MKGLGTNDETLIRIIVSRAEIDLGAIKRAFDETHPETLAGMISGDTSGNYEELLLKLLGETKGTAPAKVIPRSAGGAGKLPKLSIHEVASGKITRDLLDSSDVFVFDVGFEVFVWYAALFVLQTVFFFCFYLLFAQFYSRIGKGASKLEKRSALQYAQDYLIAYKKPLATPISRILEGGENEVFESSFDV